MADTTLLDRLARHRALGPAPASEREWLAGHGVLRTIPRGKVFLPKGGPATDLHVYLSGRLVIRVDRGAGSHKIIEWRGGDVGGVLPYSRGASPPYDAVAEEQLEVLLVDRRWFPDLIRDCPAITAILVHSMLDRARQFTSSDLRDDKLLSLGRLAAGLAHELNNPASAAVRGAKMLAESQAAAEDAARRLGAARLSPAQLAAIDAVREPCRAPGPTLSALDRADREDAIAAWLAAHGVSEWCAAPLSETGLALDALDRLAAEVGGDALDCALRWIAAGCTLRSVASTIETSASRIHELVDAVRGFTYMDRAPTAEAVDIRGGLADTLTMLAAKTREKSVVVAIDLPRDLPPVHGVGAELNQVWMNLVDNALDAVAVGGHVEITAAAERDRVVVRVVDDGPGIPEGIRDSIFEPFFTTKGVGEGSGLGLDIVRRLLQRNEGEVEVESRPGRTQFLVRLPMAAKPQGDALPLPDDPRRARTD
jgi:signal transduction histidine kinase